MSRRDDAGARLGRMARRDFLKVGAAATAAAFIPSGCSRLASGPGRTPNILFIFTDDQNADLMGYASGGRVMTPNLDALAARGTIFNAAYCNAIPCTPSRGCTLTGLHFGRWKRRSRRRADRLAPGEWTYAHALRAAGYHTGLIGKMHFKPFRAYHGFEHAEYCEHGNSRAVGKGQPYRDDYELWLGQFGLEDWQNARDLRKLRGRSLEAFLKQGRDSIWPHAEKFHPISWMRERSIAYLEARKRESRPFCLTVSIRYPHGPHNPVKRFADMYDPASIEIPTDHWDDMENLPERVRRFVKRVGRRSPRDRQPRGALQRQFSHRYALVTQIDDAVGAIMKHVDLADTLVFFSSDHGDYMGRRGRLGKQPFMGLEPVGRVPFFACGPGVPAGASVESPTALVDLAPTFLRAAGLEIPDGLDGLPLQNYFEDPDYGSERSVFCWGLRSMHMIRRGRFKFFRTPRGDAELLFDLAADPNEMKNLARDPRLAPVVQELAQELDNVRNKPPHALPRFPKARAARSPL